MKLNTDPRVIQKFDAYPKDIKKKLNGLRTLILETAKDIDSISEMEETLKWGEPSYLVKKGSTIRMDWKPKNPEQYAIYFKCTSKLVQTFRHVYGDTFNYEKNRAIVFTMKDKVPKTQLKQCIQAALLYHSVKDKPQLDIKN